MSRKPMSLRLSDAERARLNALARELGREPAVLLREIVAKVAEGRTLSLDPPAKPDFSITLELDSNE